MLFSGVYCLLPFLLSTTVSDKPSHPWLVHPCGDSHPWWCHTSSVAIEVVIATIVLVQLAETGATGEEVEGVNIDSCLQLFFLSWSLKLWQTLQLWFFSLIVAAAAASGAQMVFSKQNNKCDDSPCGQQDVQQCLDFVSESTAGVLMKTKSN